MRHAFTVVALTVGVAQAGPLTIAKPAARCATWIRRTPLAAPLGKPKIDRGADLITYFAWKRVLPEGPVVEGTGGAAGSTPLHTLDCSDSPRANFPQAGAEIVVADVGIRVRITAVEPLPVSARNWPAVRCSYRLEDVAHPELYAELGAEDIAAYNTVTGIARKEGALYVGVEFNGYAKEIKGRGNYIVALDLCSHETMWHTPDLSVNGQHLVDGDYLYTGYGFTAESHAFFVFDSATGKQLQKIVLPKSPEELRLTKDALFVRLYDGYARFPLLETHR